MLQLHETLQPLLLGARRVGGVCAERYLLLVLLLSALALHACAAASADHGEHTDALNSALAGAELSDVTSGRVVHRGAWHALYEPGETAQLHLVRHVDSVQVLQRDLYMLEPVVWFRHEDGLWRGHLPAGTDSLPQELTDALRRQLRDTRKIYAYRHVPIALGGSMDSARVVATVDSVRRAITRDVQRWLASGFFSATDSP